MPDQQPTAGTAETEFQRFSAFRGTLDLCAVMSPETKYGIMDTGY
jgi:hypothetical protein